MKYVGTKDHTAEIVTQGDVTAMVARVLHNGTSYPARPNFTYVEWVGPTQPTGAVNGDTWVQTS